MATHKSRYGFDWPAEMSDELIGLTIGKKWREYREIGVEFKDPWVPYLDAMKALFGDKFKVPEWTEMHVHDWVMEDQLVTWGPASCGKDLLPTETVHTPSGPSTIGDLRPGDLVLSATGRPARVVGTREFLDQDLCLVSFADGSSTVCGAGHLWTVRHYGRLRWEGPRRSRRQVRGWRTDTVPAGRLASWSPARFAKAHASVPLTAPLEYAPRPAPLDPYVLGCLLGDGSLTQTVLLSSAREDAALRSEFSRRLPSGYVLKPVGASDTSYMVVKADGSKGRNAVVSALSALGLRGTTSHTKFVPADYLYNSSDVRFGLLAGLFDTDGTVSRSGQISYCTVSPRLRDNVRELLESVGARVTLSDRRLPGGCTAYNLFVHGLPLALARRLFRLPRKLDRLREPARCAGVRPIRSVERIAARSAYPRTTKCITISPFDVDGNPTGGLFPVGGCVVTHNSNDTGALLVTDFVIDPYDTTTLVGSTTKDALRIRTWESVERYFALMKANARFYVPGKITQTGYSILNDRDKDDDPLAQGAKAGIHGVALNDGGKLQGAHSKYVRLVIDEIATINNHDGKGGILETIDNLQVAKDFKFVALANPEGWLDPSSQYCIPVDGTDSVSVDTDCWRSSFGCFVRHHDGLKSVCVLHPEKAGEFPFLTQQKHIDAALKRSQGNPDSPRFWKMVRGFPVPSGSTGPVVLDPQVVSRTGACDLVPTYFRARLVAKAAGVDPAWTEGGDGACYVRANILEDDVGRVVIDFTNGLKYLKISGSDRRPALEQLYSQVVDIVNDPVDPGAPFHNTAIDSSGNQTLADELQIHAGADCLKVNSADRASDEPIRAGLSRLTDPASKTIRDRGTEAWIVLAEYVRAGMVRGLPAEAARALTTRKMACRPSGEPFPKDTLEPKREFKVRFKKSPDEADACAECALAIKERLGILPYGCLPSVSPDAMLDPSLWTPPPPPEPPPDYSFDADSVDSLPDFSADPG